MLIAACWYGPRSNSLTTKESLISKDKSSALLVLVGLSFGGSIIVKMADKRAWAGTAKRMKMSMTTRMLLHDGKPNKNGYCRIWRTK